MKPVSLIKHGHWLALVVLMLHTQPGLCWSQKGHDVVACIAGERLTPAAKSKAESLLGGKSLVYWSNWMDQASNTPEHAYSKTWHYKNVDAGQTFANAPLNEKGDIVRALNSRIAILGDTCAPDAERALALKMTVHLVGDIHQPMHMGHAADRGGNGWKISFFGSPTNLHSIWDGKLVEAAHKWSHTEWSRELGNPSAELETEILSLETPAQWGEETYSLAEQIYEETPIGSDTGYAYIAEWTPVIELQFLRGGVRLAALLNRLLDPQEADSDRSSTR